MGHLLDTYYANPTRDIDAQWYHCAHDEIAELARELRVPADTLTGIVAALSPRQAWDTATGKRPNLDAARRLVLTGDAPTFKSNVTRALAIRDGAEPLDVLAVKYPKTRNFYQNLSRPGATTAVTLDVHMATALGISQRALYGQRYETAAQIVRSAAATVHLPPDAFQAAVWAQIRRSPIEHRSDR